MKTIKYNILRFAMFLLTSFLLVNCSSETDSNDSGNNETLNPELTIVPVLVLRSEYESVGDLIYNIDDSEEGNLNYSIEEGSFNAFFSLNTSTGELIIQNEIEDQFNQIDTKELTIKIGNTCYDLTIKDAFDYYLSNLPNDAVVLDEHNQFTIDEDTKWTAINNLWGRGNAIPNQDFRIATIHYPNLPNGTVLIWDVPSKASDFGGASVWCYNNVFWGNRKNRREDLSGFPFQIQPITNLKLNFDIEQLFGNDQFKIAMNMFMTDESELTNFSNNDGDFFFVFDQKDTFIPNYSNTLPDITIGGKPFAVRYDLNPNDGYERRRVIVKGNEKLLSGTLDILAMFNMFIDEGFLNELQYIYHLQFGVEVTSGWGAIQFNQLGLIYESN